MYDNFFSGCEKMSFRSKKNHFLFPKNKLSDVSKTYIDISNGQKFELLNTYVGKLSELILSIPIRIL